MGTRSLLAVVALIGIASWQSAAHAARPLKTDDADPVAKGHFQFKGGIWYEHVENDSTVESPFELAYGLVDGLELSAGLGGVFEQAGTGDTDDTNFGLADLGLGLKWKVLSQQRFLADQSLALAVTLPVGDENQGFSSGECNADLTWIASRGFTDRLAGDLNLGYSWIGDTEAEDFSNVLHCGVALRYALSDRWEPVAEIIAEIPIENGGRTAVGVNAGIRWKATPSLQFDAAIGSKLANDWPDVTATVGFTFSS